MRRLLAFTLIEILIATTIFLILTGIIANMLTSLQELGDKSVSITTLHQQAGTIIGTMTTDIRNMHMTTALALDFSDAVKPNTTFMGNEKKEHGRGGSYGPYSLAPNLSNTDFIWIRYEFDFMNGMINRGHTRPPASPTVIVDIQRNSMDSTNAADTKGINQYQRIATPQTHISYFEGLGNVKTANANWTWNDDASILPTEKRRMFQHVDYANASGGYDADESFCRPQNFKYFLYTHGVVGNHNLLSEDAYAVRNPDGMTYNKDRLNLVGAPDKTVNSGRPGLDVEIYENQIHPLGVINNIECALITYHMADESAPIDSQSMGLGNTTSFDVVGTGPQLRRSREIGNRPVYAQISFLLHTITNDYLDIDDLDQDGSTTLLIDAIRNQIHNVDGTPLTDTNYHTEMQTRRQAMETLIRDNRHMVQSFTFTVKLAK